MENLSAPASLCYPFHPVRLCRLFTALFFLSRLPTPHPCSEQFAACLCTKQFPGRKGLPTCEGSGVQEVPLHATRDRSRIRPRPGLGSQPGVSRRCTDLSAPATAALGSLSPFLFSPLPPSLRFCSRSPGVGRLCHFAPGLSPEGFCQAQLGLRLQSGPRVLKRPCQACMPSSPYRGSMGGGPGATSSEPLPTGPAAQGSQRG